MSSAAEEIVDPYSETVPYCVGPGENVLFMDETGKLAMRREDPNERPNTWKGARRIMALSDECISVIATRPSGIVDYAIDGTRVSWGHGKKKQGYLCHRHNVNKCPHTKRVDRYRGQNFE